MRTFLVILVMLVAILLVVFGAQNTQLVNIRFFAIVTPPVSLSLVIMVSAVAGALLVALVGVWGSIRRGLRSRREGRTQSRLETHNDELKARIDALEHENADLRQAAKPADAPPASPPAEPSNAKSA